MAVAVLPAMAFSPKEFTPDCKNALETLKSEPCIPAGMPIVRILFIFVKEKLIFLNENENSPLLFKSLQSTSTAESIWDTMVPMATPSTPI